LMARWRLLASIERTAYPRFKQAAPVRELHEAFTPTAGEADGWGDRLGVGADEDGEAAAGAGGVARCRARARAGMASADVSRVPAASPSRTARWPLTGSLSRAVSLKPASARPRRAGPVL
jgi:hypothetical protein